MQDSSFKPPQQERMVIIMTQCGRKMLAVLVAATLAVSNSAFAGAQGFSAPSAGAAGFSTSFETGDGFLKSTVDKDSDGAERIHNVRGSAAERMIGDVTSSVIPSSVTGSGDFNTTETKTKLFDSNPATKWLSNDKVPSGGGPVSVSFQLSSAKAIRAYSVVSANDADERDPKSWKFYGSADGSAWTPLDTQTDIKFDTRYQQQIFSFTNQQPYAWYKLEISANAGNSQMTQFADLNLATLDPADGTPAPVPMNTMIDTGPASVWNQKANAGWSGAKALTVSGTQLKDSSGAYCYNVIYDNVNVPITENTQLSYVIFPQYLSDYDFDYSSMYISVDLEFDDGTYLSESGAVDQNGNELSPLGQGKSRTLLTRQWNKISSYLNTGDSLVGKTIKKILVGYQNDDPADKARNFLAYIDDIRIEERAPAQVDHLSDYVSILRGTNDSPNFSRGLTAPAATVPHGFNFWAPVTNSGDNKMYNYQNDMLQHITVSHEPSYWVGDRGTWQFMVNTSLAAGSTGIDTGARAAKFSHDNETAKAHYYSVKFTEGAAKGSQIELSPADHAAAVRFTFDSSAPNRNVIMDSVRAGGTLAFGADNKSFTARTDHTSNGMQSMYVYGEFDQPFTNPVTVGKSGMVSFPSGTDTVTLRLATSFISAAQAKKNMEGEVGGKSFDKVYGEAQKTWDDQLGTVEIEGATEDQLRTFYSCMYRLFAYPNLLSEQTGEGAKAGWQYRSPYGSYGVVDGKLYYNNGFWDTYRTTWAAYALLTPGKDSEMLNGLVQHYIDQGWVPRWIAPGGTNSMVGTSSDVIFGDAVQRGIPFDVDNAYLSALKNGAVVSTNETNGGRKGLVNSIFDGFTSNSVGEGMSWSMEGYINDYGISQLAKYKKHTDEYKYYRNRAQNFVNLFSTELGGWFSGKNRSGDWTIGADSFDPTRWGGDYTETNAWNMAFSTPQDGRGLANLYGGREKLAEKLDEFFTEKGTFNPAGYGGEIHEMKEAREVKLGQYGHSNQPSHHIPYMYDYAGRPDRTQQVVRDILSRCYVGSDFGQGYIGDEDNGEMSAWYIFSALGFYPVSMGNPEFAVGSPLFKKATIHLENGKNLVISAPNNSKENVYIQNVKRNGEDYDKCYFLHSDLLEGGSIDFEMGSRPSQWGSSEEAMPASITQDDSLPRPIADMTATNPSKAAAAPSEKVLKDCVYSAESDGAEKLFDNDSSTKAVFTPSGGAASVYYSFPAPVYVEMYTVTSSADKTKAPTGLRLYGSNDGTEWTQLDSRTDVSFDWGSYTRPFALPEDRTAAKYCHYRLDLSGSGTSIEVAEVELMGDTDKSVDRDYLKTLILQASGIDLFGVPASYAEELKAAVAGAKEVYNDSAATEQKIYDAATRLKKAIDMADGTVRSAYENPFEAESYDQSQGIVTDPDPSRSGGGNLGGVQHGEWVRYNNIDFGESGASHISICYSSSSTNSEAVAGRVEVVLDSLSNPPSATVPTNTTGSGWGNYVLKGADISPAITGTHNVYLRFYSQAGRYVANVDYIQFTENPASADSLKAVIEKAESLHELDYTAESWNELQGVLADAKELMGQETPDPLEIKQAVAALKQAVHALELVGGAESPNIKADIPYGSIVNRDNISLQIFSKASNPLSKVQIEKDGALIEEFTAEELILRRTETGKQDSASASPSADARSSDADVPQKTDIPQKTAVSQETDATAGAAAEQEKPAGIPSADVQTAAAPLQQSVYNLVLDLSASEYGDGRYDISAVLENRSSNIFRFIRDTEAPVITVKEDDIPPTATVADSHLDKVTVNGDKVTLSDGKLTFVKAGEYKITATDKAGNTATAEFTVAADTCKITAAAGSNGSVSPSSQYVKKGEDSEPFTIDPDEGYQVDSVTAGSGAVLVLSDDKTTVVLKKVSKDTTITVTFKRIKSPTDPTKPEKPSKHDKQESKPASTPKENGTVTTSTDAAGTTTVRITPSAVTTAAPSGNTASLTVSFPSGAAEAVASAAAARKPVVVQFTLPSDALASQISTAPAQDIIINLAVPRPIIENTGATISLSLNLDQSVLNTAQKARRNLTVRITDSASNLELYSWMFRGEALSKASGNLQTLNLAVGLAETSSDPNISKALPPAVSGLLLRPAGSGELPVPATFRTLAVERFPGAQVLYLYSYNPETGMLETDGNPACRVDGSGCVNLTLSRLTPYVLLAQPVPTSVQIKSDTGKKLSVKAGGSYQFKITAPTRPSFVSGNQSVFHVTFNGSKGNDHFFQVTAVGKAGQGAGFYLNHEKTPRTVGTIR